MLENIEKFEKNGESKTHKDREVKLWGTFSVYETKVSLAGIQTTDSSDKHRTNSQTGKHIL